MDRNSHMLLADESPPLVDRPSIKSNPFSQINSPVTPRDNLDFEYLQQLIQTPSTDTLSGSQLHVINELENLKSQVLSITMRLDHNLTILKEKEEKNSYLTSVLIAKSQKDREKCDKTKDKSNNDEVYCACTKGCLVF